MGTRVKRRRLRKKTSKTPEDHRDGVLDGGGGAKGGDVDGFTGSNGGGERRRRRRRRSAWR